MRTQAGKAAPAVAPRDDEQEICATLARVESGQLALASDGFPRLAALLGHDRKRVRRLAAGALAACLARKLVAEGDCERLLASESFEVRWGAAFAMSRAGLASERALDVAMGALGASDGDVRWAAAGVVNAAARNSAELRTRLRALVRSSSAVERKMALLCLCDIGEHDDGVYVEALGDGDALVRIAALTALARCGAVSPQAAAAISAAAHADAEARVRRAAAAVLERIRKADQVR